MTTDEARAAVVAEAMDWLGTPFHHMGRVKGRAGGVDCAMLVAEVYARVGVTPHVVVQHYTRDWHLHRRDERFLGYIEAHAHQVAEPLPGDVVVFHIGHCFAHAAIILPPGWPRIIHSDMDARRVTLGDGTKGRHAYERDGTPRAIRFYSPWG